MVLWDSNLHVSALGALYAVSMVGIFDTGVAQKIIILLSSLGSALVCGALINDYCDIEEDRMAGKKRTIYYIPKAYILILILIFFFISQIITWVFIADPLYLSIYAIWYFFGVFYSAPPLRFKARGAAGIMSNAVIEKFFPILLAMVIFQFYRWECIPLLAYSIAVQAEIILHHQIQDYDADLKTGTRTYAVGEGMPSTLKFIRYFRSLLLVFGVLSILVLSNTITKGFILPVAGLLGYFALRRIIKSEDPSVPYSISYLNIFILGITPLYLALLGILFTPSFIPIFIIVFVTQYPLTKKYVLGFRSLIDAALNRFQAL